MLFAPIRGGSGLCFSGLSIRWYWCSVLAILLSATEWAGGGGMLGFLGFTLIEQVALGALLGLFRFSQNLGGGVRNSSSRKISASFFGHLGSSMYLSASIVWDFDIDGRQLFGQQPVPELLDLFLLFALQLVGVLDDTLPQSHIASSNLAAVLVMPGMPGMLSTLSPLHPNMSITCSRVLCPTSPGSPAPP